MKNVGDKPRILIVHNYYQIPGGEDSVVVNEKQMLERHGHKVILYSRDNSELYGFPKKKKVLLPFTTVFNIKTYREVKEIIRNHQIDIVHVHNTLNLVSPSVYYAAINCKVPVVQTIHNFRLLCPGAAFYRDGHICEECVEKGLRCAIKYNCYRKSWLQTLACVVTTKFHCMIGIYKKLNYICLTEFTREKMLFFKQINPGKIFVKPNFVENINKIIPAEKRKNRFIFAGRLEKIKGVDILLQTWKLMGEEAPEFWLCGTGLMEKQCREYIEDNGLESVKMKGFIPNTEVRNLISDSKALVLPSQWYEGFPMSIAEAFSVGTPVIASDVGNIGSIVDEGVTGCKFRPDSPEDLRNAVIRLEKYQNIYNTTRNEYREKYTELKNYGRLMEIYRVAKYDG